MRTGLTVLVIASVLAVGAAQAVPKRSKPVLKVLDAPQGFGKPEAILGYDTTIRKHNIVWAEDEIRITEPLRSFGGPIVLIANDLIIDAPIDSRPYIRHSNIHPYQPGVKDSNINSPAVYDVFEQIKKDPVYLAMFQDFYAHCYDCFVGDDNETYIPELPSGSTPKEFRCEICGRIQQPEPLVRHSVQ